LPPSGRPRATAMQWLPKMLSRNREGEKPTEQPAIDRPNDSEAKAPVVRSKLEAVTAELSDLESEMAELALAAAEGKGGASAKLSAHRIKIDVAARARSELEAALRLAAHLDRQKAATALIDMRAEQLRNFKAAMSAREKAMTVVLEAAANMAKAYGEYSEATLAAAIATPTGTVVPQIGMGNGALGPVFGPCERLLLAELWRLGPERKDGVGRFVLPFAKSAPLMTSTDHRELSAGIDEFIAADKVVVTNIQEQIDRLNATVIEAIEQKDAA